MKIIVIPKKAKKTGLWDFLTQKHPTIQMIIITAASHKGKYMKPHLLVISILSVLVVLHNKKPPYLHIVQ